MKKTRILAALLAAVLLAGSLTACTNQDNTELPTDGSTDTENTGTSVENSANESTYPGISTYNWKYNDDELMFTIDGKSYDFSTYRYYLMNLKTQFDNGEDGYWNEETEAEFREFMLSEFKKLRAIEKLCEEKGVALTEDEIRGISDYLAQFSAIYGEEVYKEQLDISFCTEDVFIEANKNGMLLEALMGKYVTEEDILSYARENYVHVKHVLIGTLDENEAEYTGEVFDEKTQLAEEIAQRAKDGEDFDALVSEYGEDPGMEASPEGYTFTYGMMVAEFEDESFRLAEGEISDPIKTSYGYHIIQKLPLDETIFTNPENAEYSDIVSVVGNIPVMEAVDATAAGLEVETTTAFDELTVANIGTEK